MADNPTKAQFTLLKIIGRGVRPGFTPRIDTAHKKHQPTLYVMRAEGWIIFTNENPVLRLTEAGRQALAVRAGRQALKESDHGR